MTGMEKNILLLNDGRTGNYRQAQAVAKILVRCLKKRDMGSRVETQEIKYGNRFARSVLILMGKVLGRRLKSCWWCLRLFLSRDTYRSLSAKKADVIISGGTALAPVNVILSARNLAKSIVVMKPPTVGLEMFDLAILPRHDQPPSRENVVVTEGALNLVDQEYLEKQTGELLATSMAGRAPQGLFMGLLIGGDAKNFHLALETIATVIREIKSVAHDLGASLLVSTSRRTPQDIEELVKKEFSGYPACKLLIIANEKNIPQAVGGILGLSRIIVISPESVMMISEAVNSKKDVVVFECPGLDEKHSRFLDNFKGKEYIHSAQPSGLGQAIRDISSNKARPRAPLRDESLVEEALIKIL